MSPGLKSPRFVLSNEKNALESISYFQNDLRLVLNVQNKFTESLSSKKNSSFSCLYRVTEWVTRREAAWECCLTEVAVTAVASPAASHTRVGTPPVPWNQIS